MSKVSDGHYLSPFSLWLPFFLDNVSELSLVNEKDERKGNMERECAKVNKRKHEDNLQFLYVV